MTSTVERFWAKVDKRGPDECWLWTASKRNKGYGAFCWRDEDGNEVQGRAHCFSYILHKGPIPKGKCVLHNCPGGDQPACCNPAHLWAGTKAENNADMIAKGRHVPGGTHCGQGNYERGERHHSARLTEDDVRAIRKARADGMSFGNLSHAYGLSIGHVFRIVNREAWSHVS